MRFIRKIYLKIEKYQLAKIKYNSSTLNYNTLTEMIKSWNTLPPLPLVVWILYVILWMALYILQIKNIKKERKSAAVSHTAKSKFDLGNTLDKIRNLEIK